MNIETHEQALEAIAAVARWLALESAKVGPEGKERSSVPADQARDMCMELLNAAQCNSSNCCQLCQA